MARITEDQLILPSLFLMDNAENKRITTRELMVKLESIFNPIGEDAEILSGRADTKFTQIVRNLKSHDTFEKNGFATYMKTGHNEGHYKITDSGKKYLSENINVVRYLLNNNFSSEDLKTSFDIVFSDRTRSKKIQTFDENITINEGFNRVVSRKIYNRSSKLRNIAIEHYTVSNRIKCKSCFFDFEDFYGKQGKGFIEIHHQKPIFMFVGEEFKRKVDEALDNLIPICSNCHRMIHRNRNNPLTLAQVKSCLSADLMFCK